MPRITIENFEYTLEDAIEREDGTVGNLYKGKDLSTGALVAIKVLTNEDFVNNERNLDRIRAAIDLNIDHSNVLKIHGLYYHQGLELYHEVLEFVQGQTLKTKLNDYYNEHNAPLPEYFVLQKALQILEGLQAIHEAGGVHRDLDPSNIMCCPDGTIKIMDLDILYCPGRRDGTIPGTRLGKLGYMSPQQMQARPKYKPAPDWDLYALGIAIYELLTGKQPFVRGVDKATEDAILHAPLAKDPEISSKLFKLLEKATAKQPQNRYLDAQSFKEAIEAYLCPRRGPRIPIPPVPPIPKPFLYGGLGVFAILLLFLFEPTTWELIQKLFSTSTYTNPPVAKIKLLDPVSGECRSPCRFNMESVSENVTNQTTYEWSDGIETKVTRTASFFYNTPGTRRVSLTVTNPDGSDSTKIEIEATTPPNTVPYSVGITVVAPVGVLCTIPCQVNLEVSTPMNMPVGTRYAWLDNKNTAKAGTTAIFLYGNPGTYTVKLTASAPDGRQATAEKVFRVQGDYSLRIPDDSREWMQEYNLIGQFLKLETDDNKLIISYRDGSGRNQKRTAGVDENRNGKIDANEYIN